MPDEITLNSILTAMHGLALHLKASTDSTNALRTDIHEIRGELQTFRDTFAKACEERMEKIWNFARTIEGEQREKKGENAAIEKKEAERPVKLLAKGKLIEIVILVIAIIIGVFLGHRMP